MIVVGISFFTGFLIINSGVHTTPKINITVVVDIPFTTVRIVLLIKDNTSILFLISS